MFASLLENLGIRPNSRAILTFQFWAVLALFAGLRGANVSDDYLNFAVVYQEIESIGAYLRGTELPTYIFEPAFFSLIAVLKALGASFPMIVFVVALLGTWVVYRSVQIYSPYPLLSMLIYFGHGFLNREMVQMQSGLAIAITLYAIRFITERKPLQYYGLVVLACTIHVVAFIMLPM